MRFKGQVGEQATMFFFDPSGNALECKAFADLGAGPVADALRQRVREVIALELP